jgi:hypothetical protein
MIRNRNDTTEMKEYHHLYGIGHLLLDVGAFRHFVSMADCQMSVIVHG